MVEFGMLRWTEFGTVEVPRLKQPLLFVLYQYSSAYVLIYAYSGRFTETTVRYADGDYLTSHIQGDVRITLPIRAWGAAYSLVARPAITAPSEMRTHNRDRFLHLFGEDSDIAATDLPETRDVPVKREWLIENTEHGISKLD